MRKPKPTPLPPRVDLLQAQLARLSVSDAARLVRTAYSTLDHLATSTVHTDREFWQLQSMKRTLSRLDSRLTRLWERLNRIEAESTAEALRANDYAITKASTPKKIGGLK